VLERRGSGVLGTLHFLGSAVIITWHDNRIGPLHAGHRAHNRSCWNASVARLG
jgi:hypothetical protein